MILVPPKICDLRLIEEFCATPTWRRRRNWTSSSDICSSASPHPPNRRFLVLSISLDPLPDLTSGRRFFRGESSNCSQKGSGSLSRSVFLRLSLLQSKHNINPAISIMVSKNLPNWYQNIIPDRYLKLGGYHKIRKPLIIQVII